MTDAGCGKPWSQAGAMLNARAENWGHGVPCLSAWTWLVTTLAALLPFGPAHAGRLVRIWNCVWLRTHVSALSGIQQWERTRTGPP